MLPWVIFGTFLLMYWAATWFDNQWRD